MLIVFEWLSTKYTLRYLFDYRNYFSIFVDLYLIPKRSNWNGFRLEHVIILNANILKTGRIIHLILSLHEFIWGMNFVKKCFVVILMHGFCITTPTPQNPTQLHLILLRVIFYYNEKESLVSFGMAHPVLTRCFYYRRVHIC